MPGDLRGVFPDGFGEQKRKANQKRDRLVNRTLAATGWRVLRVWEHALQKKDRSALVRRLRQVLGNRFQIMNCGMQRNHEAGHQSFSQLLHHPCSEGFLPVCSVFRGEAVALVMGAGDVETWREDGAKRLFPYKQHLISLGESNPSGVLHE